MNSEDEPDRPVPDEPPRGDAPAEKPFEWPRCGYCGSTALRESRRGGLPEAALRLAGCTLYRCENCGHRFAFATLGNPNRRHHGARVQLSPRPSHHGLDDAVVKSSGRRRLLRVLATVIAVLLTFLTASWLISRSERRRLESDPTTPLPQ